MKNALCYIRAVLALALTLPCIYLLIQKGLGSYDLLYVYSGYQVFWSGLNPYDVSLATEALRSITETGGPPEVLFVYPPWILVILSPLLGAPFSVAGMVWMLINLSFPLLILSCVKKTFLPDQELEPQDLALALFFPAFEVVAWGQLGTFVTAGFACAIYSISRNNHFGAALGLLVASIKPHLFFLPALYLLWWGVKNRQTGFIKYYTILLASSCLIAEFISPGIILNWLNGFGEVGQHSQHFENAVLAELVKDLIFRYTGEFTAWPSVFFPLFSALALLTWLVVRKPQHEFVHVVPVLLAVSLMFSPYGWFHDQTTLLILQCYLAFQVGGKRIVALLVAIQCCLGVYRLVFATSQFNFFFFPILMFALWFVLKKKGFLSSREFA